jgi:hypothetical protein
LRRQSREERIQTLGGRWGLRLEEQPINMLSGDALQVAYEDFLSWKSGYELELNVGVRWVPSPNIDYAVHPLGGMYGPGPGFLKGKGIFAPKRTPHYAEWELFGKRGRLIDDGDEISGVDFALKPGERLSFPDQSWFGHTEGKIIWDLYDKGMLKAGRTLQIQGQLPPCVNCQKIMQWASEHFKISIDYMDDTGKIWTWINGVTR